MKHSPRPGKQPGSSRLGRVLTGRRPNQRRDSRLHSRHGLRRRRAGARDRRSFELALLIGDEAALYSEMLGFLALSEDLLFFLDAQAFFFFLQLVHGGHVEFLDGLGCRVERGFF